MIDAVVGPQRVDCSHDLRPAMLPSSGGTRDKGSHVAKGSGQGEQSDTSCGGSRHDSPWWCGIENLPGSLSGYQTAFALVGFQGRGCAEVVQPNCCHPFLLEALLFQWPSIRRCASRTMVEHKTPESNKSDPS